MIGSKEALAVLERQIFEAIRNNNIEGMIEILGLGLDINVQDYLGQTPIFLAALRNNLPMVERLAELGADLEVRDKLGDTVLSKVLSRRYPKDVRNISKEKQLSIVKFLIASGAKLTTHVCGSLPIHIAIKERCSLNIIGTLLTSDNINEKDICRRTPLYLALLSGRVDVVKFLLQHEQIDVNSSIEAGHGEDSPLILAAKKQCVEIVVLLLFCGAIPSTEFFELRIKGPMQLLIQSIKIMLSQSLYPINPYHKYLFALYKEGNWGKIAFKPTLFVNSVSKLRSSERETPKEDQRRILNATTNRSVISRLYRTSSASSPGPEIYKELHRRMLDTATPRSVISEPPRPCSIISVSTSSPRPSTPEELFTSEELSVSLSEAIENIEVTRSSISETSQSTTLDTSSARSSFSEYSGSSVSSFSPSGSYTVDTKRRKSDYISHS
ncbi:ankyrin repeat domain-containing protein [Candidatus Mesenet endosymbiont of Phosphuga atrata]|uniref:ankyrin repeat domain-containing protein n=1 Tax=Candidatus Mesenet endosymbiont of Phosphuga atrata TaxID=3066221 RepID=UPI0030D0FB12